MIIHDRVYGVSDIREPIILELLHSQPLQRLKLMEGCDTL